MLVGERICMAIILADAFDEHARAELEAAARDEDAFGDAYESRADAESRKEPHGREVAAVLRAGRDIRRQFADRLRARAARIGGGA
jgi:hypothetical protein